MYRPRRGHILRFHVNRKLLRPGDSEYFPLHFLPRPALWLKLVVSSSEPTALAQVSACVEVFHQIIISIAGTIIAIIATPTTLDIFF